MSTTLVVLLVVAWGELRIAELLLSEHDVGPLLARGAQECCAHQHRWLLLANTLPPAATLLGVRFSTDTGATVTMTPVQWAALGVLVVAESLHWWAIATLGTRWTTGVYVVPGEQPVHRGPYRLVRHPGYLGGATSAVLLPAVVGAWWGAAVVTVAMAVVVTLRVRCEDRAWRTVGAA